MVNRKRAIKIKKILKKDERELTQDERIELAYYRHESSQKVTYYEFVLMLSTNDELAFEYDEEVWEIIHESSSRVSLFVSKYEDGKILYQKSTNYCCVNDLLKEARLNGKSIEEMWEKITLL